MKRIWTAFVLIALLLTVMILPTQAKEQLDHVTDAAELLTGEEWEKLEMLCQSISDEANCGVYAVTLEDYTDYGDGEIYEVTYGLYHEYEMGRGSDRDGIMLLLSMQARDYAIFVYGDNAQYAFSNDAQELLEEEFLPYFAEDDWYGGLCAYALTCEEYLAKAAAGDPVRKSAAGAIFLAIGISFLVSLVVVSILKAGMKNVKKQTEASGYVSRQLVLTQKQDRFTHITKTSRKIQTNNNSSVAHTGGGGSGRSGKF